MFDGTYIHYIYTYTIYTDIQCVSLRSDSLIKKKIRQKYERKKSLKYIKWKYTFEILAK